MPLKSTTITYTYSKEEITAFIKAEIASDHGVKPEEVEVYFDVTQVGSGRIESSVPDLRQVRAIIKKK